MVFDLADVSAVPVNAMTTCCRTNRAGLVPRAAIAGKLSRIAMLALLGSLTSVLATGCDDDAALPDVSTSPIGGQVESAPPLWRLKWLGERDTVTPERWLASREAKADLVDGDPAVMAMHDTLTIAAQRFRDKPRMIANRAVQLEAMLAEAGINESASEIIHTLTLTTAGGAGIAGFGSICQYYYNLRKQGLGRDAALARLKEMSDAGTIKRYGLLSILAASKG